MRLPRKCFQKIVEMHKKTRRPTFRARTFGCKVNFCDTAALAETLEKCGFRRVCDGQIPDVEIVNTCAVTARGVQKARRLIRKLRASNPNAFIVVTGCAVRMSEEHLLHMDEPDRLAPDPPQAAEELCRRFGLDPPGAIGGGVDPDRTRTFVKVQDGCNAFCSYCVVPYVRGRERSIPVREVLESVKAALESGHREIVLSGTHLGRYGANCEGDGLRELLARIAALGDGFRVRLSSIEPLEVSDELLDMMGSSKIFCPHLHLPLQSGSDAILSAMGRPYTSEDFLETLDRIRNRLHDPAITTDILVGFPGETDADHRRTLEVAGRAGFSRAHVFVFSPRPGTPAEKLAGRVEGGIARRRSREVRRLCAESAAVYRRRLVGRVAEVLPEKSTGGMIEGLCRRYQRVRFKGSNDLLGRLVPIYIIGVGEARGQALEGRIASGREAAQDV